MGEIFRQTRKDQGYRQREVAKATGLSEATVSNIENGSHKAKEDNIVCYAEFLGIKNELFGIVSEIEQREKQAKIDLLEIEEIVVANPDKALERLKQLKQYYDIDTKSTLAPIGHYLFGRYYFEKKQWSQSQKHLLESIKLIDEKLTEHPELRLSNIKSACYNELGSIAHFLNQSQESLQYVTEGIECFVEDGKRRYRIYFLLLNKAIYLEGLNRKEEALKALEELKIAISKIETTSEVFQNVRTSVIVKMYRMYAELLNDLEMPHKALEDCERGIRIAWLNNDFDRVFTLWTTLGTIHYNIGDYENTEKFYFKALDIRPKVKEEFLYPFNYVNLGTLLIQQNKLQDAKQYIEDAIEISRIYKDDLALTESLMAMGKWYIQQKLYTDAIDLYKQAEEIAQQNSFHSKESEILTNLCICFEEISDEIEFQKHTVQLFRIRKKLIGRRV